jgi:hypothetical protein
MNRKDITEVFDKAQQIALYQNGSCVVFEKDSIPYTKIINSWKATIKGSRQMPAFGVAMPNKTLSARERGIRLEFCYGKTETFDEMPFDKLLVEVVASYEGINLNRYQKGVGYSGRCFYLNLQRDMSELYKMLCDL